MHHHILIKNIKSLAFLSFLWMFFMDHNTLQSKEYYYLVFLHMCHCDFSLSRQLIYVPAKK